MPDPVAGDAPAGTDLTKPARSSHSLCQQKGCDNVNQGWKDAYSPSCVGGTRSWELDLQQGSFKKKRNAKKRNAPRRAGTAQSLEVTCPKCRAALAHHGDTGVLPTAPPESRWLLSGGQVAHPIRESRPPSDSTYSHTLQGSVNESVGR